MSTGDHSENPLKNYVPVGTLLAGVSTVLAAVLGWILLVVINTMQMHTAELANMNSRLVVLEDDIEEIEECTP